MNNRSLDELWISFAQQEGLHEEQVGQFKKYYDLLKEWNESVNLTAIEDSEKIMAYHFEDSLILDRFIDLKKNKVTADVGTGGGFPGIPLKIKYPHLHLVLIEVSQKKQEFLKKVVEDLALDNVTIYPFDWRTFIRKTDFAIDIFCARASLHPDELLRIFKPSSPYKNAQMIYWASEQWQPEANEKSFVSAIEPYGVGSRSRKLVFFKNNR